MKEYKIILEKKLITDGDFCKSGDCDFLIIKQGRIGGFGECDYFSEILTMKGMELSCYRCDKCKKEYE